MSNNSANSTMNTATAVQFIDFVNNKIADDKPPADFNFTYLNAGMPNMFTIIKRSNKDPRKSFPVLHLHFGSELDYAPSIEMVDQICELYSKREFDYHKEIQKEKEAKLKAVDKKDDK